MPFLFFPVLCIVVALGVFHGLYLKSWWVTPTTKTLGGDAVLAPADWFIACEDVSGSWFAVSCERMRVCRKPSSWLV